MGGDAAGATHVGSTLPLVYAVVVPAFAKRKDGAPTVILLLQSKGRATRDGLCWAFSFHTEPHLSEFCCERSAFKKK